MATKTRVMEVPAPAKMCFAAIRQVGNRLSDWKLIDDDAAHHALRWRSGSSLSPGLRRHADFMFVSLQEQSLARTRVTFKAEQASVFDPFGCLDRSLNLFTEALDLAVTWCNEVLIGRRCPDCHMEIAAGTLFCPNDGTEITRKCPNAECKQQNPIASAYCSKCGTNLR